jgi:hypothetical protein
MIYTLHSILSVIRILAKQSEIIQIKAMFKLNFKQGTTTGIENKHTGYIMFSIRMGNISQSGAYVVLTYWTCLVVV